MTHLFAAVLPILLAALLPLAARAADAPTPGSDQAAGATRTSTQFGATRLDFPVGANRAFVISPAQPASGHPWIWYAPTFIGTLPDQRHDWLFRQFLAHGIAIAGVDVGESYGSPAGRAVFTAFHRQVVAEHGLSPTACLLPQSRGGLMLYNWAVEHPAAVRCIGGIYTVCDLTSYPGLAKAGAAYGFSEADLTAHLAEHNPLERLAPLAAAKVPLLIIHGDHDKVVPLERNSGELVRRYRALGGPGEVLVIPGGGHENTDAFFKCQRLLDFFIAQTTAP